MPKHTFLKDFSITAVVAALLTVVVAYAGSSIIIFQAAELAGMSHELTSSWIWAVSVGSGITGLFLSWRMKVPVITSWSTPGAALLVVMLPTIAYDQAIAAYLTSAVIIIIVGATGTLDKLIRAIPTGISAGLFAGILFSFGTKVFTFIEVAPLLTLCMIAVFIVFRKVSPRYCIVAVMLVGIIICGASGLFQIKPLDFSITKPVLTLPAWSWSAILSLGVPLALVTLTGQYISGMAVLHTSGYRVPANGIMTFTGLFSLLLAPFGSHAINLSSITAAICTEKESNEDPAKRYVSGMFAGLFYILIAIFASALTTLFTSLPSAFIGVLAGLALISAFTSGIVGVVKDTENLEAGIITFLVTASGMEFLSLGAAFWGLAFGSLTWIILRPKTNGRHKPRT